MSTRSITHVVALADAGSAHVDAVGGKGAQLAALMACGGVTVPDGACVTTAAYRQAVATLPWFAEQVDELGGLRADERERISALAAQIRTGIEHATVPPDVVDAITEASRHLGEEAAVAVRSSATAEDLPSASFAGLHDTFLNVIGVDTILERVASCWASLFSERAVVYRMRHGIDHRAVAMAVVVQRMVAARASGVLFTADPLTGHRKIATIEATPGLGEALVAGTVNADSYQVRDGAIVERRVAGEQRPPALTDAQALELAALGRRIELHFGAPQDIEWCLDDAGFEIVQSRPITTLFPVPEPDGDGDRVYISVGHAQMMTDPMSPLGLSVWQLTSPAPMRVAGGRLYVDATATLSTPAAREKTLDVIGRSDPLTRDALDTVLAGDFIPLAAGDDGARPSGRFGAPAPPADASMIADLIGRERAGVAALAAALATAAGDELFELIAADLGALRGYLVDPEQRAVIMAGFEATWWLDDHLGEWLGEDSATAELSLAAPNNVSAEMGLALLDVADAIRPHAAVVARLRAATDDTFLDDIAGLPGGRAARDAIDAYLDRYGMRCAGEIDIARPRWSERPGALLPALLSNVDHFEPGERGRRLERGRARAEQQRQELMRRLSGLPDGAAKAAETDAMISRMRALIGYREYPKYAMVTRYLIYKRALLGEAERLVADGTLDAVDDVFFLTFAELGEVARTRRADRPLIARRRADMHRFATLTPPRVLTSDGEALHGAYRRDDVPAGALVGVGVSSGTVEGRARVVHDMADADVRPGDILVTAHTDPSWSPLFVTVAGLVTEAGGVTTHGSVIAREYGLAAVVGVERATERIADGRRIRVHGTNGYVELL